MPNRDLLLSIIRGALELPGDFEFSMAEEVSSVPGWDSLGWVNVLASISRELKIEVPTERIGSNPTLGEFCELIDSLHA